MGSLFTDSSIQGFIDSLSHRFIDSLIHWPTGSSNHCFTGWLINWVIASLLHCFSIQKILVHWFIDSLVHWFIHSVHHGFFPCHFISATISTLVDTPHSFNCSWLLHLKNVPEGHWFPITISYFRSFRPGECRARSAIIIIIIKIVIGVFTSSTFRFVTNKSTHISCSASGRFAA